ncbi:hypothetical protein A2159_00340 [Candidatus Woesebacteria bacterium RBG_13_34_9]|uniref:Glycoside hydrolase family 5 domain-containing protein n=1 Tax=Candidatus Woesebacteria bacterium RBG_13_34_9 TaxID=1802477 RepID=A0A1F7X5R8_9BACT|nr:MAG: hypothetical protein A2159_00340 [Candidatus Woesebacteria bacterium RBG_13_34_9]
MFRSGDIFTSCTECENGGLGDPRQTKNLQEYRNLLTEEHNIADKAFNEIGVEVVSGYYPMNADVAKLVMDKKTADLLGGVIVLDHYVKDPDMLANDIKTISASTDAKIILGEFGAPISDIHGEMTEKEQANWIDRVLVKLSGLDSLIGVNYWTSYGGSTALWNPDGTERKVVGVLKSYFIPKFVDGKVINELEMPVKDADVLIGTRKIDVNEKGEFNVPVVPSLNNLKITALGYNEKYIDIENNFSNEIVLIKSKENIFFKLYKFLRKLRSN